MVNKVVCVMRLFDIPVQYGRRLSCASVR